MDIDKTLTRVDELWFFDGGLVVQAEQSLYRVSGGILAARSPVFKDMLSLTQPPDAETIDGCPVVRLPDRAVDVTCFFRAIFDSSFFEPHPRLVHLHHVFSILHLSNKYSIDYLLRRALTHLASVYPTTLSGYYEDGRLSSLSGPADDDILASNVATIQVAREVNALWILPSAFYHLASTDGAVVDRILQCVVYGNRPAKLSDEDRILFLKSSMQIYRELIFALRFLNSPHVIPGCTGTKCTSERSRLFVNYCTALAYLGACDRLELFHPWKNLLDGCCQVCIAHSKTAVENDRQAFWDKLPEICGLPSWEVLEKMKEEALKE
ncbi:hypothetical protein B0H16DRAFT_1523676 [Mycena metata]|uniref:BTB domain-containing protein n=1 Tax=Mycena metata TaxID=1033252 RepID=A0AAD7NLU1_9AGAR|nr:hypothetical protein B0H16DRAFT_1523676 [Mycena metata]